MQAFSPTIWKQTLSGCKGPTNLQAKTFGPTDEIGARATEWHQDPGLGDFPPQRAIIAQRRTHFSSGIFCVLRFSSGNALLADSGQLAYRNRPAAERTTRI